MSEVEFRGSEAELISRIGGALEAVRSKRPLVHNITNYVVMNWTANALLAIGAAPVMAHALEEVEEMAGLAGALVLNIGTLSPPWVRAMVAAGKAAKHIPIVLDPVGAGATVFRTETARRLLQECPPRVVRGNASEILALAGEQAATRGVDAASTVEQARAAARDLAKRHGTVLAVTGPEDFVTDGRREARIANGHELMARVTGTGCAASALTGAFCAVDSDALVGAVAALVVFGIAGELAASGNPRPGTFQTRLLDALDEIRPAHVQSLANVKFFA